MGQTIKIWVTGYLGKYNTNILKGYYLYISI